MMTDTAGFLDFVVIIFKSRKAGRLEGWKAGKLEGWKARKLGSWEA